MIIKTLFMFAVFIILLTACSIDEAPINEPQQFPEYVDDEPNQTPDNVTTIDPTPTPEPTPELDEPVSAPDAIILETFEENIYFIYSFVNGSDFETISFENDILDADEGYKFTLESREYIFIINPNILDFFSESQGVFIDVPDVSTTYYAKNENMILLYEHENEDIIYAFFKIKL